MFIYLFIYVTVWLTTDIPNPQLIKSSHVLHELTRIMYLVHVYPRHIFKAHLIIYLYPRASLLFHSVPRTNTCGCISVQSNTCHMHRPSHPPVRITVQIRTVIITQISYPTFSLLHTHVCFSKGISTAVNPFVPYFWLVMLFNTLCLCDTLYFKFEDGEIKQNTINKYWGGNKLSLLYTFLFQLQVI